MMCNIRHLPDIACFIIFQIFFYFCVGDDKATMSSVELYRIGYQDAQNNNMFVICQQDANTLTDRNSTTVGRRYVYTLRVYKNWDWAAVVETHPLTDCAWSAETFENSEYVGLLRFESAMGNNHPVIRKNTFKTGILFQNIILSENAIQTIESGAFGCQPDLKFLDLSKNYIESLPVNVFQCMSKLRSLSLIGNRIGVLPPGIFDYLRSLKWLDLSSNLITKLPDGIFHNNARLRDLDLGWNKLETFSANISHLRELEILNITRNCLSGTLSFRVPDSLRTMSVSNNTFTNIAWSDFRHVERLWAENNEINSLAIQDVLLTGLQEIHLETNKIERVFLDSNFTKIPRKFRIHIYLSGNLLLCGCHAFKDYMNLRLPTERFPVLFVDGLVCQNPPELKGREMGKLLPDDFQCEIRESCPEMCRCVESLYSGFITVNCSGNGMKHLPVEVPINVNILIVDQNDLTSLASLNETRFENLTEVHARENRISSEEFFLPRNLKLLFLDGNKLTTLPETIRIHMERTKDFRITLSGNTWPCECSSLPLKSFFSTHGSEVKDVFQIRCTFSHKSANNFSFLEMKEEDLCASNSSWFTVRRAVLLILGVAGILLTGIYNRREPLLLVLLYTKYNWLYRLLRCRRWAGERKMFDCFLSYGSEDWDVTFAITHELEDVLVPPLTFCFHERNWKGGAHITDSIFLSVEHCRKTLIVLSRTFVKNKWFRLEFQAALIQTLKDRRERIILVLKGDMPDSGDLPRDVQHFLETRTYLVWGERWFFEKLKYSLQDDTVSFKEVLREIFLNAANGLRSRRRYREDLV